MRRTQVAEVLARRLRVTPSRVQGLTERLSDSGLVTKADRNRKSPPDLAHDEIVRMALAVAADRGLGRVIGSVTEFGELTDSAGRTLFDVLSSILDGSLEAEKIAPGALVLRLEPAWASLLTSDGRQVRFGSVPPEGAGKFVSLPGQILAAAALEVQGCTPAEADARINRALSSHAPAEEGETIAPCDDAHTRVAPVATAH